MQYILNLAYHSATKVVLRILPVANTQAACRAQNVNVFNKGPVQTHADAVCMLSFFWTWSSVYLIWNAHSHTVAFQYMQNILQYDTVAGLDSKLAGCMGD